MGKISAEKNAEKKSKKVICIDTGVEYPSISAASRDTGINPGGISRSCYSDRKIAGGFRWGFIEVTK
jgi:hypothetical protein